jgi:hypothetical protein
MAQLMLVAMSSLSGAATVEQVTAACDKTKGCNYTTASDGDIVGCSTGSHTCFVCDNKTRNCISITKRGDGKYGPGKATNIGGVKLPAGSTPKGIAAVGQAKPPTKIKATSSTSNNSNRWPIAE